MVDRLPDVYLGGYKGRPFVNPFERKPGQKHSPIMQHLLDKIVPNIPEIKKTVEALKRQSRTYVRGIPQKYQHLGREWADSWDIVKVDEDQYSIGNRHAWAQEFEFGHGLIPPSHIMHNATSEGGILAPKARDVS